MWTSTATATQEEVKQKPEKNGWRTMVLLTYDLS